MNAIVSDTYVVFLSLPFQEVSNPFYFKLTKTGTFHGFSSWFSVDFLGFPTHKGQEPIVLDTGPDHP